ncbi:helix-turn-helix domain-containing protein [Thiothrix unzii]|jgi:hypothetical protein|uniref:Helix-turn-helix domain-containing protein n=1 Tax=Thiothrix unzii TaxID=111769 RepID=A0A975IHX9_9GAMM|nr:helix-turn-helix domain-containing protein [Thiothrix unzii]QTR54621.1 helix-turn-helix domain-containing protein [Thiothrix unzii]
MHLHSTVKTKQRVKANQQRLQAKINAQMAERATTGVVVNFALENRLSTRTAASYLGIRSETLARWRAEERLLGFEQPNFYRIGKKIVYLKNDLDEFLLTRGEASLSNARIR